MTPFKNKNKLTKSGRKIAQTHKAICSSRERPVYTQSKARTVSKRRKKAVASITRIVNRGGEPLVPSFYTTLMLSSPKSGEDQLRRLEKKMSQTSNKRHVRSLKKAQASLKAARSRANEIRTKSHRKRRSDDAAYATRRRMSKTKNPAVRKTLKSRIKTLRRESARNTLSNQQKRELMASSPFRCYSVRKAHNKLRDKCKSIRKTPRYSYKTGRFGCHPCKNGYDDVTMRCKQRRSMY